MTTRRVLTVAVLGLAWAATMGLRLEAQTSARWTIPVEAADEKNTLPSDEATLKAGRALYEKHCINCHGKEGKGDGPDADKRYAADMDLTAAARAARNPDGTVFYKIWNGRLNPKMPAFSDKMSKNEVWQLITYMTSIRQKPRG
jgi:mono/diheme cytochrome c family protein